MYLHCVCIHVIIFWEVFLFSTFCVPIFKMHLLQEVFIILFFIYSAAVLNRTFILFIFNIDNDMYGSIQIYQLIICFSICLTFYIFFQIFVLAYFPLLLTYKLYFFYHYCILLWRLQKCNFTILQSIVHKQC